MSTRDAERAALIDRCRHQRHELIATTATATAALARARGLGRWLRITTRLARMLAAGMRRATADN
jgi:hypothetical protein